MDAGGVTRIRNKPFFIGGIDDEKNSFGVRGGFGSGQCGQYSDPRVWMTV